MKRILIKDHIIKIAADLFYQNGYNRTGINEIISEAGIAKATLYNHFKSKEDICIAYLRYKNSDFNTELKAYVSKQKPGKNRVLALFDFLDLFYNADHFNGCWCINTISEIPRLNENIRTEVLIQKESFIDYISILIVENLEFHSQEESKDLARKIYILYEGAIAESNLQNAAWPIASAKSICKTLV